jgi:hypothetical protein
MTLRRPRHAAALRYRRSPLDTHRRHILQPDSHLQRYRRVRLLVTVLLHDADTLLCVQWR